MSRSWRTVSKAIQRRAAGLYAVMSEGMFPYEIHYVLVTDEEVARLCDLEKSDGVLCNYRNYK